MSPKHCASCGTLFTPRAQVPDQTFCSQPDCQRERRQRWNREKLRTDPDYVDNKRRAQRAWLDQNPDYWRQYRAQNPTYTEENRRRQREKGALERNREFAKRDASKASGELVPGFYRLISLGATNDRITLTVEIRPLRG